MESSADALWKEMQADVEKDKERMRMAAKKNKKGAKTSGSVVIASLNKPDSEKKKKKKNAKSSNGKKKASKDSKKDAKEEISNQLVVSAPEVVEGTQSASELLRSLARDVNGLSDPSAMTRKKSADKMFEVLFGSTVHKDEVLQELFDDLYKPLFKRFDDPTEKVRERCVDMSRLFFEKLEDLMPPLPYLFPAIISRCSDNWAYDVEQQQFVRDLEYHEAFRRGRALEAEDMAVHRVVEPSEEIRLKMCRLLATIVRRAVECESIQVLHPYFNDIALFAASNVNDPFQM
jgi:hypothetical protein